VVKRLSEWAFANGWDHYWGKGKRVGAMILSALVDGEHTRAITLRTEGTWEVAFQVLARTEKYAAEDARERLRVALNQIDGVDISPSSLDAYPRSPLSALAADTALSQLQAIMSGIQG